MLNVNTGTVSVWRIILPFVMCALPLSDLQAMPACTETRMHEAGRALGEIHDWNGLYNFFLEYSGCDEGELGESYANAVNELFIQHWHDVQVVFKKMRQDDNFKAFVQNDVGASVMPETSREILWKAKYGCPPGYESECHMMANRISKELKQEEEPPKLELEPPASSQQAPLHPF